MVKFKTIVDYILSNVNTTLEIIMCFYGYCSFIVIVVNNYIL